MSLNSSAIIVYYRDSKIKTSPEKPHRAYGACFIICTEDNECPKGQNAVAMVWTVLQGHCPRSDCKETGDLLWVEGKHPCHLLRAKGTPTCPLYTDVCLHSVEGICVEQSQGDQDCGAGGWSAAVSVARSAHQPKELVGREPS